MTVCCRVTTLLVWLSLAIQSYAFGPSHPPTVDLGWIRASQKTNGWLVAYSSQIPRNGNAVRAFDVLVSIDGQSLAQLNPLSVANLLQTLSLDATTAIVVRDEKKRTLVFEDANPLLRNVYPLHSVKEGRLFELGEVLPWLTLPDTNGVTRTLRYEGHWTMLRVGSFFCDVSDVAAFNEISKTPSVQFAAISEYDGTAFIQKFMSENRYDFPVLVAYDSQRIVEGEKRFDTDVLPTPGAVTYILIAPTAEVVFVSTSGEVLKSAWMFLKSMNPTQ